MLFRSENMFKNRRLFVAVSALIFFSVLVKFSEAHENKLNDKINLPQRTADSVKQNGRSASPAFNPLAGVWQSASRMLGKGLHQFRASLQEGVKVAKMLKDDVDEGVTHIIKNNNGASVSGTSQDKKPEESNDSSADDQLLREGVLGGLLRFMGVNSNNMGVIALNVLIILGEWITSALIGKDGNSFPQSRMVKTNLLEWVVKGRNEKIDKMLKDAQDKALPENIIDTLQSKTGNSTSCVQLLICKMSPFIWGVQSTLDKQFHPANFTENLSKYNSNGTAEIRTSESNRAVSSIMDTLYKFIPNKHDFVHFGDNCEKRFPSCRLLKFANKVPLV